MLGISGIIMTAGIAPLMYTIRIMANTRKEFTSANLERNVFNRMIQDMRGIATLNSSTQVCVVEGGLSIKGDNDLLFLLTTTPSYSMLPMGTVVYGLPQETVLSDRMEPGLYRWVLSEDVDFNDISFEELKSEAATMLIPDLKGIAMRCIRDIEWESIYSGGLPKAYKVTFEYEDRERTYETWLPEF